MGGLGINKLKDVNTALLAKWGWRYKIEKDNLWVRVINALHEGGFTWDCFSAKKSFGGVWSNIVSVLKKPIADNLTIRCLFKGAMGMGENIMFWLDPWQFDVPLKDKFPSLFLLEVVKTCSVRERLEGEGLWLWRHDPDSEVERIEWQSLASALNSVRLSSNPNKWSWAGLGTEGFSFAIMKKLIDSKRDYSSRIVVDWCK
ncbi:uncharacterized protein LOC143581964 [Bidens hawaiensis]|uniref:uncharacterized protein LOC143581964 n=1 Tax=Bidens hawaiensis TaxID=980011 RepID=UPI004049DFA4